MSKIFKKPKEHLSNSDSSCSFRLYLQAELVRRCQDNPRYSLRAFAKSISIDPGSLSKILSGSRPVGSRAIESICIKLALKPSEIHEKLLACKKNARLKESIEFLDINIDEFQLVADWCHFAILELIRTSDFVPKHRWIAKKLGKSIVEINACIDRLIRAGLLKKVDNSYEVKKVQTSTLNHSYTTLAHRQLQEQFLKKSIVALNELPIEKRHQSGVTMAISKRLLPKAVELTAKYRKNMAQLLSRSKSCDSVYQLSISLFPLTT